MLSEDKIKEYGSLDINKISMEIPILAATPKARQAVTDGPAQIAGILDGAGAWSSTR